MPTTPAFRFRPWARAAVLGLGLLAAGCGHTTSATTGAPRPTDERSRARAYLEENQPQKALGLLKDLHAKAPEDLDVARTLTEAQVKAGRTDAWIEELQARIATSERAVDQYMLGLALFSRAKDAGAPAVTAFERAITLSPDTAEYHHRLGVARLESEQYAAAVEPLRRAAALAHERTAWRLPLAKALHRTGDPAGAVEALGVVVRGRPAPSDVATARALMEQISDPFGGIPKAAEAKLEEGLRYLNDLDAPQHAILAFEEVLHDYPDLAVLHSLLGLAYQRLDDAGRAVDEFKQAIESAPRDGKNHLYLGELYASRQRPDAARASFEKAVALHPLLDAAWFRLGDLHLDRRDLAAAREAFIVAVSLSPDSIPARGKLALVYQLDGDYPAAERELRYVVEKDPENVEFSLRLGLLFTEQSMKSTRPQVRKTAAEEAERWLSKVLEAQPENAIASRALQSLKGQ
ncbi:tetratricopeptide repeat protein [Myxococcus llanfairpwllgwyngyllgogerychwyrndrobwllllantysiliogogogochensis]|uniref:Tetratricopeptide repeat protein n=1 Tax=Myxococcus llanfairpwllgwyngyllgogerychwyrndrobwllllantysiliogogogochensis TaxID=2590453 RepID=A0A540WZ83_9BACT|nr:tetratricopeptide repeat protein [Myxococcus llanfairpwllgwyngyllgogerychwyrndrobwllllantysiliogogogochensis]TQF14328.1 tetratricopeptide repeat protein [Myxococcus llanfairpwllgwyngyllgogerychwyrndrobwllllantysiliogogogochensis]